MPTLVFLNFKSLLYLYVLIESLCKFYLKFVSFYRNMLVNYCYTMTKYSCNRKFLRNSKRMCWISKWTLPCTFPWKVGLGEPRVIVGVFRKYKWVLVTPMLLDLEVTTSRSSSGQELGRTLEPWSAELHGALWYRLHLKPVVLITDEGAEPKSQTDGSSAYMMRLPS